MKERFLSLLLPMLLLAMVTMAQESDVFQLKNSTQLDIGGHGLVYSFNIEAGLGFIAIREAARDSENNPDYWFWR